MALNALGLGLLFTAKDLASGVMQNVRNGFAQTRDEMGRFGGRSKQAFAEFGTGLKIMGVGLAGLATLGIATDAAAKFSTAVAKVATIADKAEFPLSRIEDIGFEMGRIYGGDLETQLAALYSTIGSGAQTAAEATSVMHSANQLAIGGLTSTDVAMTGLMGTLNAFQMDLRQSQEVADSFFQAVKIGGSDLVVGTLADALGRVSPTASALGIRLDELTGSIARMTQVGIKTSEAVTGFKAILDQIIKPSGEAVAEAARLGIKLNQHSIKMAGGFEKFVEKIVANPRFNKDTIKKLFGASSEAMNAFISLSTDGGKKFKQVMADMASKGGAAKAAFDQLAQTPEHLGKVLKTNLQEALVKVGKALEPVVVSLLKLGTSVVGAFNRIPAPMRDFMVKALAAAAAVTALVGAVVAAKAGIAILAAAAKTFGVGAGAGLVSTLWPAVLIIGLVTAAVLAFRYAVENNLGGIGDKWNALVDGVQLAWEALTQLFTDGGFSGRVRDEFLRGDNAFVNFALKVWLVVNRVQEFLSALADGFEEVASTIDFEGLSSAFDALSDAIGSFGNDAAESGEAFDAWGRAGLFVGKVIGGVVSFLVDVLTAATNIAAGFAGAWDEYVSPALSVAGAAIMEVYEALSDIVSELADAIGVSGDSGSAFQMVGTVLAVTLGTALRVVASLIRVVAGLFRNVGQVIGGVVDVIAGVLSGDWTRAWNGAKRVVFGVVSGIVDVMTGLVQVILDAVDALASVGGVDLGLGKKWGSLRQSAKDLVSDVLGVDKAGGATYGASFVPGPAAKVVGSPETSASPAVASMPGPNASYDPAAVARAAAEGASSKPVQVQVGAAAVYLDSQRVGQIVLQGQQASAMASYQPLPVSSE